MPKSRVLTESNLSKQSYQQLSYIINMSVPARLSVQQTLPCTEDGTTFTIQSTWQ